MADLGYLKGLIRGIPDAKTRVVMEQVVTHIVENLRFGVPDHQSRAENFQLYFQESTTAPSTSEASFTHGLTSAPKLAIPVLDLQQPGSQLVPLEVTRVADTRRVYLKSTSTSARFMVLIE